MFEVGKKVICVKTHSQGVVKRGQVFELLAISKSCCDIIRVDIGIRLGVLCSKCSGLISEDITWLNSTIFAPYDDSLSELTTSDILEEILIH